MHLPQIQMGQTLHGRASMRNDAHRPLAAQHVREAIPCQVDSRVIADDYTIRHEGKMFQIASQQIRPRMRRAAVRIESRRNGQIAVRFQAQYLPVTLCQPAAKADIKPSKEPSGTKRRTQVGRANGWLVSRCAPRPRLTEALAISNATS